MNVIRSAILLFLQDNKPGGGKIRSCSCNVRPGHGYKRDESTGWWRLGVEKLIWVRDKLCSENFLGRRIKICTPAVGLFYKRCPLYAPRERQEQTIVLTRVFRLRENVSQCEVHTSKKNGRVNKSLVCLNEHGLHSE